LVKINFNWYLNRLSTFTLNELIFRIKQYFNKIYERLFKTNWIEKNIDYSYNNFNWELPANHNDEIFYIFNKKFTINKNINWHKDYFTNRIFPKTFSKGINPRTSRYGIAKVVWEINRLQFLIDIIQKYLVTKEERHLNLFISIVISWKESNPYLIGINWYSNIEVNLRLITWFWCWTFLDIDKLLRVNKKFRKFVNETWIPIIYQHCVYSYNNPSKFSSANNHLVSEYAGLFIATSLWNFPESKKWNLYSKLGLEKEIQRQHTKSGINKEEAAEYIQFITDFFLLSYIVGKKNNNTFSNSYKLKLRKIIAYIYHFTDNKCNFPKYGDEDDGRAFILENQYLNNYRSLIISGAILFNKPEYKAKAGTIDKKNIILFGKQGINKYNLLAPKKIKHSSKFYKEDGHFIFKNIKNNKEIYIHFNAAPIGYLSIAAHGHSDALSFILNINGNPFLVDSGTFCYHSNKKWRNYFKGTLAHNTIRVDKQNQAKIGGPTLWLNHYKCDILDFISNNKIDFIKAKHDGYKNNNVDHIRQFKFYKKRLTIIIIDKIKIFDNRTHYFELPFHLHPKINVKKLSNNHYKALFDSTVLIFEFQNQLDIEIVKGQKNPLLGWYSNSFYQKEPCPVLYTSFTSISNIIIKTKIRIEV